MAVRKFLLLSTLVALHSHGTTHGVTLWDTTPTPFNHTNASHYSNDWLPHGLCAGLTSGSHSNRSNYQVMNVASTYENEVHSFHNEFKHVQITSEMICLFGSTKDKTGASFTPTHNPMRGILSVCRNKGISSAKSHWENNISLRIVNKYTTIDTLYYASDMEQRKAGHHSHIPYLSILYGFSVSNIECLMVVLMLVFIMCKCPKRFSFNAVILMAVCGVFGDEFCDTAYECVGQSRPINRALSLFSRG
eukprot:811763_1